MTDLLFKNLTSLNSFFLSTPLLIRVDKKRDKIERKILDSQERAFWDVHRPVVGEIIDVFPAGACLRLGVQELMQL